MSAAAIALTPVSPDMHRYKSVRVAAIVEPPEPAVTPGLDGPIGAQCVTGCVAVAIAVTLVSPIN